MVACEYVACPKNADVKVEFIRRYDKGYYKEVIDNIILSYCFHHATVGILNKHFFPSYTEVETEVI